MKNVIVLLAVVSGLMLAGVARVADAAGDKSNGAAPIKVLFIGNSLSRSLPPPIGNIAKARNRTWEFEMIAKSSVGWDYHIKQQSTIDMIGSKKWDYVVIQDYSNRATHIGDLKEFMKNGEGFYRLIREKAPQAKIVLYQTYAYADGAKEYTNKQFAGPAAMTKEIADNYTILRDKLEAIEPGDQVLLAPVGVAFQLTREADPSIELQSEKDTKHGSDTGKYLAALVLYSTLFHDAPPATVPGAKLSAEVAGKLQKAAVEAIASIDSAKAK